MVNLVTETLFGGRQKLRRARSRTAFAHGACRSMAEGVEGENEQNFTKKITEKCSDRLVDGIARKNEVIVKASSTAIYLRAGVPSYQISSKMVHICPYIPAKVQYRVSTHCSVPLGFRVLLLPFGRSARKSSKSRCTACKTG